MGVSHKNTTHTTMKTAFLTRSRTPARVPPPGKRAGRLERDRAYYPAQPGRRSRRDTPISSPKDIAGYRPNGPFNTCTSPPPTLAEILRVLLETRLEIKPIGSSRERPTWQLATCQPAERRAISRARGSREDPGL